MAIKRIGVLTSGGDAPGMNAAIRAVVRMGVHHGLEVFGIRRGYQGLLDGDLFQMESKDVSEIIGLGGTILYTARCDDMTTDEGCTAAAENCKAFGLDAIICIGGDGTFRGAAELSRRGINVIGVPATIDLDIASTDYTIGFDTAVNTAMEAIDKIRDSSASHSRCSIVEVMGRTAGYIAMWAGVACGAEAILIPEKYDYNEEALVQKILDTKATGKKHFLIVNAEGIGHSTSLAKRIEEKSGISTNATVLAYIQRGGSPSAKDRYYASIMGARTVELLLDGKKNRVVAHKLGEFPDYDITEATLMKKEIEEDLYKIALELKR